MASRPWLQRAALMTQPLQTFAALGLAQTLSELRRDVNDFTREGVKRTLEEAYACDYALSRLGYWESSEVISRDEVIDDIVEIRLKAGV